jgi:LAGLIDADG endonuclease
MTVETELAWCAGFFDGEGCISCVRTNGLTVRLDIDQKDRQVLDRFRKALGKDGFGLGIGLYRKGKLFQMYAHNSNAITIFNKIKPYLSPIKIEQGEKAIAKYTEYHMEKHKEREEFMKKYGRKR